MNMDARTVYPYIRDKQVRRPFLVSNMYIQNKLNSVISWIWWGPSRGRGWRQGRR